MYKVYCLKNKQKEIVYVGITKRTLAKRLGHHKASDPKKVDLTIELISEVPTQESAFILEALLINQYGLVQKGLNKSTGYDPDHVTNDSWREHEKDKTNGFYKHKQSEHAKEVLSKRSKGNSYAKGNPSRKGRKNGKVWREANYKSKSKPVMCVETGEVFGSAREAAKAMNLQYSKISLVCNKKRKTTGGYTFIFV